MVVAAVEARAAGVAGMKLVVREVVGAAEVLMVAAVLMLARAKRRAWGWA